MTELVAAEVLPSAAWLGDDLSGRQILVIGASGALGRQCALDAASRGATVILLGRRVASLEKVYDEIEAKGYPQAAIYPLNLEGSTPADFAELGRRIIEQCGRLDGVIHCAGHLHGLTPIEFFEPEEWLRSLQVGLNAPFLLMQSLLPALRLSKDAVVIFVLDDVERATRAFWGAYGITQAALRALIGMLGNEWANENTRVLGLVPAPLASQFRRKAIVSESPDGLTPPARYAPLMSWLLSHAEAGWSGQIIDARQLP